MRRQRRRDLQAVAGDIWWGLFDANGATRFSDGERDYVEQLVLAVLDSNQLLNRAHVQFLCKALWEACIL
jgi:hypothetical protein